MQLRYVTGSGGHGSRRPLGDLRGRPRPRRSFHRLLPTEQRGQSACVAPRRFRIGHKNDLGIEVAGTKGTLRWRQEEPESVTDHFANQPDRVYWRGAVTPGDGFLPEDVPADLMAEPTIPAGHPEAFHDAFARLHRCFEADVRKYKAGEPFSIDGSKYATSKTAGRAWPLSKPA